MSALFLGRQGSISWPCQVAVSSFSLPAHRWWGIQRVSIYTIPAEEHGMNVTWNMSSRYFNTTWCLWLWHVVPTSADRASRRPAASSRVPRAWIQGGRCSQWDSKPHCCPYSHSGRQCSPLTTHMPRGVRNPDSTRHARLKWIHRICGLFFTSLQRQARYRLPWWPVWVEGWRWSCSSSGPLWRCGYTQTRTTPPWTPANPTVTQHHIISRMGYQTGNNQYLFKYGTVQDTCNSQGNAVR